jgi:hypothetical protein
MLIPMAKRNASTEPSAEGASPGAPQSHVRIRPPSNPIIDALWARYEAGEITIDQAVEEMKAATLNVVKNRLADVEYDDLEEFMRTLQVPHVDKLRRSK